MKKHLLILLISSVSFVACNNDDDENPTPTPTPTPTTSVKAGSKFTYTRTDYDSVTGTQVIATYDYTLTMVRDTTINNEKWFVAERKDPSKTQFGLIMFNTNGMSRMGNNGVAVDYKFGAVVNDTWVDANGETCTVKSINQSVTVPAGSFTNAIYIETHDSNDPGIENKSWYNDKEIKLKNEEYDNGGTLLDYRDELKSVQL